MKFPLTRILGPKPLANKEQQTQFPLIRKVIENVITDIPDITAIQLTKTHLSQSNEDFIFLGSSVVFHHFLGQDI